MAKLGKVKIMLSGAVLTNTTYPGQIELYAHYDVDKDYFFFENEELQKKLPDCPLQKSNFEHCGSKEAAIAVVKIYMGEITEVKRFLRISLDVKAIVGIEKEQLHPQLQNMTTYGGARFININPDDEGKKGYRWSEQERNIGLSIERVLMKKIGTQQIFIPCNKNWEFDPGETGHTTEYNLIEWHKDIEDFLLGTQEQMSHLAGRLITFFNVPNVKTLKNNIQHYTKNNLLT